MAASQWGVSIAAMLQLSKAPQFGSMFRLT
jgi:hypothetical protein